jgi:HAD superfamily hydrolase (TIGR01490 family)
MRLALFDLDHTLLSGDSDVLWCEFLMHEGVLRRDEFAPRNAQMEAAYKAGTVDMQAFADFYASTLAGRTPQEWEPLRDRFVREVVAPRIPADAVALVKRHLDAGDLVVMTTATGRFITERTAALFDIPHLIATEMEFDPAGRFTGRASGVLNLREGKVRRLRDWLALRGQPLEHFHSTAYSDSINDLPLLSAVNQPIAVDPDPRLLAHAQAQGWPVQRLQRDEARTARG